jgi:hypothetical protein
MAGARRLTGAATAAVVVALLALVALASRAPLGGGAHDRPLPDAARQAVADAALVLAGAGLAASLIVVALIAPTLRPRRSKEPPRAPQRVRKAVWDVLAIVAAIAVCGALIVAAVVLLGGARSRPMTPPGSPRALPSQPAAPESGGGGPPGVWLLGGALLVIAGAVLVSRRARPRGTNPTRRPFLTPRRGGDDTGPWPSDPRMAVLAAYRRGERLLGRVASSRRPAEGPREFRDRVRSLDGVDPVAVDDLTALYERARFSGHHVSQTMSDDAVRAYEQVRRRLEMP